MKKNNRDTALRPGWVSEMRRSLKTILCSFDPDQEFDQVNERAMDGLAAAVNKKRKRFVFVPKDWVYEDDANTYHFKISSPRALSQAEVVRLRLPANILEGARIAECNLVEIRTNGRTKQVLAPAPS